MANNPEERSVEEIIESQDIIPADAEIRPPEKSIQ